MPWKLLAIALGGAAGALARFAIGGLVGRIWEGASLPWGTLAANGIGCAAFGLLWPVFAVRCDPDGPWPALVFVGFLGAMTTFSTYAFESVELLRPADGAWAIGAAWIAGHTAVGMVAVLAGLFAGRWLLPA